MSTASGRAKMSRAQLALAYLRLKARVADALEHYGIGAETVDGGLPVDWRHVSLRMAEALLGEDDLPPPRDETQEPEDDDGDPELTRRMGPGGELRERTDDREVW